MSKLSHARLRPPAVLAALVTLLSTLLIGVNSAPAEAATALGRRAVAEAARHQGQPYVYGAAGPTRFDCSGFTLYVYGRFGKQLTHNAAGQYSQVRHIPWGAKAIGDLIFMRDGGGIGHVGIYAGGNRWWVAPHSGTSVKLQTLYSSDYVVGRP